MTIFSITEVRNNLGDLVNKARYRGERISISCKGTPAAALVPVEDAQLLDDIEDRVDLAAARQAMKEPGLIPWEKVKKDLGL